MALLGKLNKNTEDGKDIFIAEFTNGTIEQLKELAHFLESEGFNLPISEDEKMKEVVRIGISWLETMKEKKEKEEKIPS